LAAEKQKDAAKKKRKTRWVPQGRNVRSKDNCPKTRSGQRRKAFKWQSKKEGQRSEETERAERKRDWAGRRENSLLTADMTNDS
jgi:hypothetical protein